ncbi:hypothetical protein BD293_1550 [Roseinatronobacter monicus]|uniref:Uncharacterized protein n=1 Tax=Roseinatronobacter monicus TaxID=393481 RepID=A0A543KCV8_9RHOB|nr:hypothetical protein BD293_1550 [Roseinatronobacter monicus]
MVYSATTPATDRKARFTRASNPGLFGSKGVSISLVIPAASAARKMRLRRIKNCDAANGSPKSATSIAQALSYAAHSGDNASGVSSGSGTFLGISLTLARVGSSQRYNTQPVITQNINKNGQSSVKHATGNETLFGIVLTVIKKNLRALPVETGRIGKMQTALSKILRGFGLVPFKLPSHMFASDTTSSGAIYHERKSPSKLYMPVGGLWINNILRQAESRMRNVVSVEVLSNLKYGHLIRTEATNA